MMRYSDPRAFAGTPENGVIHHGRFVDPPRRCAGACDIASPSHTWVSFTNHAEDGEKFHAP